MIISLNKSKLFTVDPARRFAKQFNVPEEVWRDCWLRYKVKHYTNEDLKEYIELKAKVKLDNTALVRWIDRTEIYSIAQRAFKMDATTVVSSFFEDYEQKVLNELLRNMKSSVTKDSRSII